MRSHGQTIPSTIPDGLKSGIQELVQGGVLCTNANLCGQPGASDSQCDEPWIHFPSYLPWVHSTVALCPYYPPRALDEFDVPLDFVKAVLRTWDPSSPGGLSLPSLNGAFKSSHLRMEFYRAACYVSDGAAILFPESSLSRICGISIPQVFNFFLAHKRWAFILVLDGSQADEFQFYAERFQNGVVSFG